MPRKLSNSLSCWQSAALLVNEFGKFIAQTRYEKLPAAVIETVKLRVLDLLAAALAGFHMGCHKQLLPLLGGAPQSTAWGVGSRISSRDATLLNSFMAHALYLDDGSRFTGGHPSSVVIPSAVALAETQRATGSDLIAAIATGYEIFLRLGRAIYPSTVVRGFQSTAVLGAAASASACANLLRFSPEVATHALAIACNLGVGLKEALKSSGSQPIQVGRSCESGLLTAQFAAQGAEGADHILEGGFLKAFADNPTMTGLLDGLGTEFRIFETYIKVHGGCRGNHAPVDVVQDAVKANAIIPAEIASILIRIDSVTYAAEIHHPLDGEQAQFSVAFSVAAALVNGDASIFQYTDANVADPRIRAMMGRIHVEVDKGLDPGYPDQRAASTEIVLVDGRRISGHIDNARGEPECPLTAAEIEGKFLTLTREILGGANEQVLDTVMGLESLRDVNALTVLLKADVRFQAKLRSRA